MKKRKVAIFTVLIFLISLLPIFPVDKVHAYSTSDYLNELKIGLESMASASLKGKTSGEYYLNGKLLPSGSALTFTITNGKVNINGTEYSSVTLVPKNYANSLLSLTKSSTTFSYRGSFTFKIDSNRIYPINSLYMEDYLRGVVGYEMSDSFNLEALKAQAVAARTYALRHKGALLSKKGCDFNDTTSYQVYKGYNSTFTNVEKAVKATIGQTLVYNDKFIEALFSASHGGYTEDILNVWDNSIPTPYLVSKPDTLNGKVIDNSYSWTRSYTSAKIDSVLKVNKYLSSTDKFVKLDLNSITKYVSGRVSKVNIIYTDASSATQTKSVTKDQCRTFLSASDISLPSSMWTAAFNASTSTYTFTGRGNGHGLGMSQLGAKARAEAGQTYKDILSFYYEQTKLVNLYTAAKISSYTESTSTPYIGQPVVLSAGGSNGTGKYQYNFKVTKDGKAVYETGYTDSSTYTYTPSAPGSYSFTVYLKDSESASYNDSRTLTAKISTSTSIALDKAKVFTGQAVNASATVKNGSGKYEYKYEVSKSGKVLYTRNFSSDSKLKYTPSSSGSYSIKVYVKDLAYNTSYYVTSTASLSVYDKPTITSLSSNGTSIIAGQAATFTVQTKGGSGSLGYKYIVYKSGKKLTETSFGKSKTYTYTPSSTGSYEIYAYIKDNLDNAANNGYKSVKVNAYSAPKMSTVTVNHYTYATKSVTVTAGYTFGSPLGSKFKYEVYRNGALYTSKNFTSDKKFTFIPSTGGTYTIKVYLKDSASKKSYDVLKTKTFTISNVPVNITSLPLSYGKKGSNVTSLQKGLIKLGYKISADGIFGSKTKSSVIAFQKSKKLKQTGAVDKTTLNAINAAIIAKVKVQTIKF